jgi:hypothetical protein
MKSDGRRKIRFAPTDRLLRQVTMIDMNMICIHYETVVIRCSSEFTVLLLTSRMAVGHFG